MKDKNEINNPRPEDSEDSEEIKNSLEINKIEERANLPNIEIEGKEEIVEKEEPKKIHHIEKIKLGNVPKITMNELIKVAREPIKLAQDIPYYPLKKILSNRLTLKQQSLFAKSAKFAEKAFYHKLVDELLLEFGINLFSSPNKKINLDKPVISYKDLITDQYKTLIKLLDVYNNYYDKFPLYIWDEDPNKPLRKNHYHLINYQTIKNKNFGNVIPQLIWLNDKKVREEVYIKDMDAFLKVLKKWEKPIAYKIQSTNKNIQINLAAAEMEFIFELHPKMLHYNVINLNGLKLIDIEKFFPIESQFKTGSRGEISPRILTNYKKAMLALFMDFGIYLTNEEAYRLVLPFIKKNWPGDNELVGESIRLGISVLYDPRVQINFLQLLANHKVSAKNYFANDTFGSNIIVVDVKNLFNSIIPTKMISIDVFNKNFCNLYWLLYKRRNSIKCIGLDKLKDVNLKEVAIIRYENKLYLYSPDKDKRTLIKRPENGEKLNAYDQLLNSISTTLSPLSGKNLSSLKVLGIYPKELKHFDEAINKEIKQVNQFFWFPEDKNKNEKKGKRGKDAINEKEDVNDKDDQDDKRDTVKSYRN